MYICFALCKLEYLNLDISKVIFTSTDLQLMLLNLLLCSIMRA